MNFFFAREICLLALQFSNYESLITNWPQQRIYGNVRIRQYGNKGAIEVRIFLGGAFVFGERFISPQIPLRQLPDRNDMVTVLFLVPKFLFWNTLALKFQL